MATQTTVSEEAIRDRTGRGWDDWFSVLDEWGAVDRPHPEIASWLMAEQGVSGWDAQSITVSYERARGLRAVGEKADGFAITAAKTIAVPAERVFDAWVDPEIRRQWLPDAELGERTSARPKGARFDFGDGSTRVVMSVESKGDSKSTLSLSHEKLPDAGEADRMKAYWRERVVALKELLEA